MSEDRRPPEPRRVSAVERRIARSREDDRAAGRLSEASIRRERTLEGYLKSGLIPRYMERLRDIHTMIDAHRRALAEAHTELRERHAGDDAAFARAWRERVERWSFDEVNELIRQHNEWYPVERQLPFDLRTRDYVLIAGRSYRREELTADWALEQFP
jgi:exoribonuclease II